MTHKVHWGWHWRVKQVRLQIKFNINIPEVHHCTICKKKIMKIWEIWAAAAGGGGGVVVAVAVVEGGK